MAEMTSRERILRAFEHREADRVPVTDDPWPSTLARWRREGMPAGVAFEDEFGLDRVVRLRADNSPRYPERVLEETDAYVVRTTKWGVTIREWKDKGGVPEFLDHTITDPDRWREAKARMSASRDRVDWARLEREYRTWRERGDWIEALLWFGFDVTHSWTVGTERVLLAMAEKPEWMAEMFRHLLDVQLELFDRVWEAGYPFDAVFWYDDLGYKNAQFFSVEMYRELLRPAHARACEWARAHGCKVHLHSCGDIRPFLPDLIEIGVEMLNPVEVKAGMDPVALKAEYGDRLAFHGGLDASLFGHWEALEARMRAVLPAMKRGGGYWASSDHSVPDSVSRAEFRRFAELARALGTF